MRATYSADRTGVIILYRVGLRLVPFFVRREEC
jgi:hypothetical protein